MFDPIIALLVALAALLPPLFGGPPTPGVANYAALGDSYTSGPLIPLQRDDPWGCLRSTNNYPSLVAPSLPGLEFRDVSCAGADTKDMTSEQGVTPGPNPPQFDALDAATELVTVQIGGNDIGFSSIAQACGSPTPSGTPCQDAYVVDGDDELRERVDATSPKVAAVLAGIKAKAPNAEIFVVNYSALFPHSAGVGGIEGCWPIMTVSPEDVPYLRGIQEYLNAMLETEATAAGVGYVDVYAASVGHDACAAPPLRWTEPVVPSTPAAPLHPNLIGMIAMADLVKAAIAA